MDHHNNPVLTCVDFEFDGEGDGLEYFGAAAHVVVEQLEVQDEHHRQLLQRVLLPRRHLLVRLGARHALQLILHHQHLERLLYRRHFLGG